MTRHISHLRNPLILVTHYQVKISIGNQHFFLGIRKTHIDITTLYELYYQKSMNLLVFYTILY